MAGMPIEGTKYDSKSVLLIIGLSLFSFLGQNFISRAFQLEKASVISPLCYISVPISLVFDVFIQNISYSTTEIIGCVLIVGPLFLIAILKSLGVIK